MSGLDHPVDAPRYAGLGDYLALLRRQWLLLLVPLVIGGLVAYLYADGKARSYTAQTQILLQDETQQLVLLGASGTTGTASAATTPGLLVDTLDTRRFAARVRREHHLTASSSAIQAAVSLTATDTGLLDVAARSSQPAAAARIANGFARTAARSVTATVRGQLTAAIATLERRLAQLPAGIVANQAERSNLQDEISRLVFLKTTATPAQVLRPAAVPSAPSSPRPARDGLFGLLGGLLVGLVAAALRETLDRRVRGSRRVASELGLPLLAQVRRGALDRPVIPRAAERGDPPDVAGDVETFRILRGRIERLLREGDRPRGVVLVTSALPEEGSSAVAASLALASAAAGRRTLLIDADVRRPEVAQALAVGTGPGLAEYLVGDRPREDVTRPVSLLMAGEDPASPERAPVPRGRYSGVAELNCVTAGAVSGGSVVGLSSERMRKLLDAVAADYDLVLIDGPPLLTVADARELLPFVDMAVVCVRGTEMTPERAEALREALAEAPTPLAGAVVTDLRRGQERSGAWRYPYARGARG